MLTVTDAVNLVRVPRGAGDHLEGVWKRTSFHHEGVIAHDLERRGQPHEDALAVVLHLRGLPMHNAIGAHDTAAVGFTDRLMTQAYAQNRDTAPPSTDRLDGDSRLGWRARSGR